MAKLQTPTPRFARFECIYPPPAVFFMTVLRHRILTHQHLRRTQDMPPGPLPNQLRQHQTCAPPPLHYRFHVPNDAPNPLREDEARTITHLTSAHDSGTYNSRWSPTEATLGNRQQPAASHANTPETRVPMYRWVLVCGPVRRKQGMSSHLCALNITSLIFNFNS